MTRNLEKGKKITPSERNYRSIYAKNQYAEYPVM